MFVSSNNPNAKVNALERLGRVCPNPDLVRFSTTLASKHLTGTPKHLVLSTDELSKDLEDFLTEGDDHHIHLVVEQKSSAKNDSLFLRGNSVKNIRHLTLSDPNGFAHHTAPSFLSQMENLISLDMKSFSAMNRIIAGFGQQCSSLTFFDPRGLSGVTHIDSATFLKGTPFKSKEPDQLKKLYKGKNTESSLLFIGDLYNRLLQS